MPNQTTTDRLSAIRRRARLYRAGWRLWKSGGQHGTYSANEAAVKRWCAEQNLGRRDADQVLTGWRDARDVEGNER